MGATAYVGVDRYLAMARRYQAGMSRAEWKRVTRSSEKVASSALANMRLYCGLTRGWSESSGHFVARTVAIYLQRHGTGADSERSRCLWTRRGGVVGPVAGGPGAGSACSG